MGQITVNLSDEMLKKISDKIWDVNGDSIGDQVLMFLDPWIQLVNEDETHEILNEFSNVDNKYQEKYVVKQKGAYRIQYSTKDGLKPAKLTVMSSNLSKLNELSRHMQACDWDRAEWEKQKSKLSPTPKRGNIYNRQGKPNTYYVQIGICRNAYTFGYSLTYPEAEKIRDYIQSLSKEDKIRLSYQHYGVPDRGEYTRKILEMIK